MRFSLSTNTNIFLYIFAYRKIGLNPRFASFGLSSSLPSHLPVQTFFSSSLYLPLFLSDRPLPAPSFASPPRGTTARYLANFSDSSIFMYHPTIRSPPSYSLALPTDDHPSQRLSVLSRTGQFSKSSRLLFREPRNLVWRFFFFFLLSLHVYIYIHILLPSTERLRSLLLFPVLSVCYARPRAFIYFHIYIPLYVRVRTRVRNTLFSLKLPPCIISSYDSTRIEYTLFFHFSPVSDLVIVIPTGQ